MSTVPIERADIESATNPLWSDRFLELIYDTEAVSNSSESEIESSHRSRNGEDVSDLAVLGTYLTQKF